MQSATMSMFAAIRFGLDNGYTVKVSIMGDNSGNLHTVADKRSAKVIDSVLIVFEDAPVRIAENEVGDVILARC